jgi:hypothetical protein
MKGSIIVESVCQILLFMAALVGRSREDQSDPPGHDCKDSDVLQDKAIGEETNKKTMMILMDDPDGG